MRAPGVQRKRRSTSQGLRSHHPRISPFTLKEPPPVPAAYDDIQIGQVVSLGACAVDPAALDAFIAAFTPGWTVDRGAPDAMIYAHRHLPARPARRGWPAGVLVPHARGVRAVEGGAVRALSPHGAERVG
jgi:hypothetical protein